MRKIQAALVGFALLSIMPGCSRDEGTERWATTENTNVKIDWDKVNDAYKNAEGPQEFETKVNEIYEGDELISVSVHDKDAKNQTVTGFFDRNANGTVEDAEKVFTITREIKEEGKGNYHIAGHGSYYGYYRSPFWDITSGMIMGMWISSAFRPGYAPMYTRPYVTSSARATQLRSQRSAYRAKNPSRFARQRTGKSGRTYGTRTRSSSGRRSGGGGFGIRGRERKKKPVRLTA